jgi:hypothetical protein
VLVLLSPLVLLLLSPLLVSSLLLLSLLPEVLELSETGEGVGLGAGVDEVDEDGSEGCATAGSEDCSGCGDTDGVGAT